MGSFGHSLASAPIDLIQVGSLDSHQLCSNFYCLFFCTFKAVVFVILLVVKVKKEKRFRIPQSSLNAMNPKKNSLNPTIIKASVAILYKCIHYIFVDMSGNE